MKPAQSGCTDNIPDLDYALALSGIQADPALRALLAPACMPPPALPTSPQKWKAALSPFNT